MLRYLQTLTCIIEQLKFAVWWNTYQGATGWKAQHKAQLTSGKTQAQKEHIIRKFNKARTCRNTCLRLYQKVCDPTASTYAVLTSAQIGATIILQPLFMVQADGKGSMHGNRDLIAQILSNHEEWLLRSALLTSIQQANSAFDGTPEDLLQDHIENCHNAAVKLIVRLLSKGGGNELGTWAQAFFDKYDDHKEIRVGRDSE